MVLRVLSLMMLSLCSGSLLAEETYYLQFELFKFQQKVDSGKDYVSTMDHTWSKGLQRNYLKLSCTRDASGRNIKTYTTVEHFAGIRVTHHIAAGNLYLKLTRLEVQPRVTEIRALPKNECREMAPVVASVSENYVTPLSNAGNKNYPFGKEMSIRISLSPLAEVP